MCVSWCHRLDVLYWNHLGCERHGCHLGQPQGIPRTCTDCIHHRQGVCGLTGDDAPAEGCCHWNVELTTGPQAVTDREVAPLQILGVSLATLPEWMDSLGFPYKLEQGSLSVDPDKLPVPDIYGQPTDLPGPELPESEVDALGGAELLDWEF